MSILGVDTPNPGVGPAAFFLGQQQSITPAAPEKWPKKNAGPPQGVGVSATVGPSATLSLSLSPRSPHSLSLREPE